MIEPTDNRPDEFDQYTDAQLKAMIESHPRCATTACENGWCVWAGTGLCYPCSVKLLGREVVEKRYAATHDHEGYLL